MPRINSLATLPKRKADFIEPMECAPVTRLVDGPGWTYEIKFDGYRAIAVKSGLVNLFSRRHKSFNRQYPHKRGENPSVIIEELHKNVLTGETQKAIEDREK